MQCRIFLPIATSGPGTQSESEESDCGHAALTTIHTYSIGTSVCVSSRCWLTVWLESACIAVLHTYSAGNRVSVCAAGAVDGTGWSVEQCSVADWLLLALFCCLT